MRYLLAALLLVSAASAQVVLEDVNCTEVWRGEVDTTVSVPVHFLFDALAPYFSDRYPFVIFPGEPSTTTVWGYRFYNASRAYVAGVADSGRWDRDLRYEIAVEYWSGSWNLTRYRCTATWRYGSYTWTETRYYYKVEKAPPRKSETVAFTVPRDRVSHFEIRRLAVSARPDRRGYSPLCAELPSKNTWPNCGVPFTGENVVLSGSSPSWWKALEINGLRPGSVVSRYGVNATIPDPWYYTDMDYTAVAMVRTDMGFDTIRRVYNLPFSSTITIRVRAVPAEWGSVEFRSPKSIPLYISRVVATNDVRARPPETFLVGVAGNATWVGDRWVWNWTLASIAQKSPFMLTPYVAVDVGFTLYDYWISSLSIIGRNVKIYVPLGSITRFRSAVFWRLEERGVWIGSRGTYLRAVDNNGVLLADHYEEAGARGKLAVDGRGSAAAVDSSMWEVVTAWYAPPDPCRQWPDQLIHCVYSQHVFTKVNGSWVGYSRIGRPGSQWPMNRLVLVDWLIPSQPFICGVDRFRDFMNLVAGDPVLHYWHTYRLRTWMFNPQTGDWDIESTCILPPPHEVSMLGAVYGLSQYRNTTKDEYGAYPLYQQTAQGFFYNYVFVGANGDEKPAGWTDALPLGISSMVPNSTGPWALFLVPTTACASLICTELKPTLWGPAPGPTADLALAGTGYSFLLVYLGEETRERRVRIYVEMGYVAERARDGMRHRWVRDYLLAEVDRYWRPLDAVYVGPRWAVDYRPLSACQPLELGVDAVYVAPVNWTGPVQVIVEEDGRRYYFVFFVSNDVSYRIVTDTPAPARLTAPFLNTTLYFYLAGVPYFHGVNALGEGGRQRQHVCVQAPVQTRSLFGGFDYASQLAASGDFWGRVELYGSLRVESLFSRPRFELADPRRGLVRITAEGPVYGFAFYLMRNGTWSKVDGVGGRCVVVNASRIYPWDPVLVLPLVRQELTARPGDVITLWRPATATLFKTWADEAGYPKEAKSVLEVVGIC